MTNPRGYFIDSRQLYLAKDPRILRCVKKSLARFLHLCLPANDYEKPSNCELHIALMDSLVPYFAHDREAVELATSKLGMQQAISISMINPPVRWLVSNLLAVRVVRAQTINRVHL